MTGLLFIIAGAICRFAMAGIFVQSAWHALRDASVHEGIVANYRLLPSWAVAPAAWVLPLLGLLAAVLLLAWSSPGAALGFGLMLIFTAAIAINLWRGHTAIECGCGAGELQTLSWGLLARNLCLLAALACGALAPQAPIDAMSFLTALGGAGSFVALYFAASQLLANTALSRA